MNSSSTLANLLATLRGIALVAIICLLATPSASADTRTPIDTITATAVLPDKDPGVLRVNESFCDWHIVVWATENGGVEYEVLMNSIVFHDDGGYVDLLPTSTIFTVICAATAERGIELGYSAPHTCPSTGAATVLVSSCVARLGSGNSTAFSSCNQNVDRHFYNYCTQAGVVTLTATGVQSNGCSATGCESTWEGNGGGLN